MRFDPSDPSGSVFAKLIGLPAWQVRRGAGGFVTMDFGKPHLDIRDPLASMSPSPRVRDRLARRRVRVRGQWHLWVYCCRWRLLLNDRLAAHDSSADAVIDRALERLDGQKLVAVQADEGRSEFHFDIGATFMTRPAPVEDFGPDAESWLLFAPRSRVLSLFRDGSLTWTRSDEPPAAKD